MSPTDTISEEKAMTELLIFTLEDEEYALKLTDIQEIIKTPEVTAIPNMPASVRGVSNLRGRVVTVIDLGLLFGVQASTDRIKRHVIIAEHENELFGLLVDNAAEVFRVNDDDVKQTPDVLQAHQHAHFLRGVIVVENEKQETDVEDRNTSSRIILALDVEKILPEISLLKMENTAVDISTTSLPISDQIST